jgi:hypothetical protein
LKILRYRNDEAIHKNGEIVHQDGEALQQIASSMRREAEETRVLLECSVKDSKRLKSLSFISMIYLPANLVAVSIEKHFNLPLLGKWVASQTGNVTLLLQM